MGAPPAVFLGHPHRMRLSPGRLAAMHADRKPFVRLPANLVAATREMTCFAGRRLASKFPGSALWAPFLELDDISLGILRINHLQGSHSLNPGAHDFSHSSAAGREHRGHRFTDIIDRKRNVTEAWPLHGRRDPSWHVVVGEYFKRRSVRPKTRQAEVDPRQMRARLSGQVIEPLAAQISLGWLGHAAKDIAIEFRQRTPVAGGKIGVDVTGTHNGDGSTLPVPSEDGRLP